MDAIEVGQSCRVCTTPTTNYSPRRHSNHIFSRSFEDLSSTDRWRTSGSDYSLSAREFEQTEITGRRRNLIKKIISERVLRELETPDDVTPEGTNPSEYNDNFCVPDFTPFLDKPNTDASILTKYPLYSSNNQTIYKDQIDRGTLKARADISNLNEPFRKNCTFTTSPDMAIREPVGGF